MANNASFLLLFLKTLLREGGNVPESKPSCRASKGSLLQEPLGSVAHHCFLKPAKAKKLIDSRLNQKNTEAPLAALGPV